jgi:hypothetical protein
LKPNEFLNRRWKSVIPVAVLLLPGGWPDELARAGEEPLFVARSLTAENSFTTGIEGPACDARGNIYAVNFDRQQTIGRVRRRACRVFVECPAKPSNGIVIGAMVRLRRRLCKRASCAVNEVARRIGVRTTSG